MYAQTLCAKFKQIKFTQGDIENNLEAHITEDTFGVNDAKQKRVEIKQLIRHGIGDSSVARSGRCECQKKCGHNDNVWSGGGVYNVLRGGLS